MINPTETIIMTTIKYVPQFSGKASKCYDADFFIPPVRLGKMYLNKYTNKKYQFTINPFKVEAI